MPDKISMDKQVINTLLDTKSGDETQRLVKTHGFYKKWAENYDADCVSHGYRAPELACEVVLDHVKDKNAYIMSLGGGTGLDGQKMYEAGYRNLDCHDGSEEMLEAARSRNVFKRLYCEMLQPNTKSGLETEVYDALVCVGCFVPNHLQNDHVDDLLRPVKKGGIIIFGTREMFVKPSENWNYDLDEKISELVKEGKVELVERRVTPDYYPKLNGVFHVMRKL